MKTSIDELPSMLAPEDHADRESANPDGGGEAMTRQVAVEELLAQAEASGSADPAMLEALRAGAHSGGARVPATVVSASVPPIGEDPKRHKGMSTVFGFSALGEPDAAAAAAPSMPAAPPPPAAPSAASSPPAASRMMQTALGVPGVDAGDVARALAAQSVMPAPTPDPARPRSLNPAQTVLGMPGIEAAQLVTSTPSQAPVPGGPGPGPLRIPPAMGTVIGMPSSPVAPAAAVAPMGPQPPSQGALRVPPAMGTMLGMPASMTGAPSHVPGASGHAPAPRIEAGPLPVANAMATMLGMASPGVSAPPGAAQPSGPPHMSAPPHGMASGYPTLGLQTLPPIVPAPAPFLEEAAPVRPEVVQKRGFPLAAAIAAAAVLVVLLGVGAFFLFRAPPPLTATAAVDAQGQDQLDLRCASCPDGTTITCGDARAQVTGQTARLAIPLKVGDNPLALQIDRPGMGRDESVKLTVPVGYRLRADASELASSAPKFVLRGELGPGHKLQLDGQDVGGPVVTQDISLGALASGPRDTVATFDKTVTYKVTYPDGHTQDGTVNMKTRILPLQVDTPRPGAWIDGENVGVAGRTTPGATVVINGTPAPVNDKGVFQLTMPFKGQVEIRTSLKDAASRTAVVPVERVDASARKARQTAFSAEAVPLNLELIARAEANLGKKVVLDGEVVESRSGPRQSVLLLNVNVGGPARAKGDTLVRIVVGGPMVAERGARMRVYGSVAGLFDNKVLELDAAFVARPPSMSAW